MLRVYGFHNSKRAVPIKTITNEQKCESKIIFWEYSRNQE